MSILVSMPGSVLDGCVLEGVPPLEARITHATKHGCGLAAGICARLRAAAGLSDTEPDLPIDTAGDLLVAEAMEGRPKIDVDGIPFMMRGRELADFVCFGMRRLHSAADIAQSTGYTIQACAKWLARGGFRPLADAFLRHDEKMANLRSQRHGEAPTLAKVKLCGDLLAAHVRREMSRLRSAAAIASLAGFTFETCVEQLERDGHNRLARELEWHDYELENLRTLAA